jgi:hypothetical protein
MGQLPDRLKRQRGGRAETDQRDDKGFRERLDAAAEAKKALVEKFRAQAGAADSTPDDQQPAQRPSSEK